MRRNEKIIYKATNSVNNKVYIGFCVSFKERKARHLKCAEKGVKTKFYHAIRKYGRDSFVWEIIESGFSDITSLKEREKHYIRLYDSYITGYNSTIGGDGGFTGINAGMFKKGMKPWCTGKSFSEEHLKNMSLSHMGIKQSKDQINKRILKLNKIVLKLDLDGKIIEEFSSIKEAANGISSFAVAIGCVCSNKKGYKSARGFKWEFKNN